MLCLTKEAMAGLCFSTLCPNPEGLGEEFYSKGSRMGLPIRIRVCAGSRWSGLLILMRLSCPFNLDSGGFLVASTLISNCLNLLFGTQRRLWKVESCLHEMGDKKASVPGSPKGPCLASVWQWRWKEQILDRVVRQPWRSLGRPG